MVTLQELQLQRATFITARQQGKINQQQLNTALAENQRQIDALKASQVTVNPNPPATTVSPPSASPLPAETPAQQYTDQQGTTWRDTQAPQQVPEALQLIPTAMGPIPLKTFQAGAKDPTMQNVVIPALEVAGIAALSAIPGAAPVVIGGAVAGVGLDIGIKSAVKSYETNELQLVLPGSVREVTDTALLSAGLSAVGGGALGAVGKIAPSIAGQAANPIVRAATRTAINAGLGGGVSGVASGGNPQAILEGAALGAGLGVAGELAGPIASKTNALIGKTGTGKVALDTISTIRENTVGSRFLEITGGKEVVSQQTTGKTTDIIRVTQPEIKTVTLRGEEARFYKANNLETMKNPIIELSGTQRTMVLQKDAAGVFEEIQTYPKPATRTAGEKAQFDIVGDINRDFPAIEVSKGYKAGELPLGDPTAYTPIIQSVKGVKATDMPLRDPTVITSTRSAKPILEALKGDTATFEKITPISEAKITVTKGRISPSKPTFDIGVDKPITVLEKTAIVSDTQFLPNMKSAFREYNSIRIYDKPIETPDLFSRATGRPKNVAETPELFERVTGKVSEKPVKTKDGPFVNNEQINILKDQAKTQKLFDKAITDKAAFSKREAGDLSGPMKAGSNEFFRKTSGGSLDDAAAFKANKAPDTILGKNGQTLKLKDVTTTKQSGRAALDRAIVGQTPKDASAISFSGALTATGAGITFKPISTATRTQNDIFSIPKIKDVESTVSTTPQNLPTRITPQFNPVITPTVIDKVDRIIVNPIVEETRITPVNVPDIQPPPAVQDNTRVDNVPRIDPVVRYEPKQRNDPIIRLDPKVINPQKFDDKTITFKKTKFTPDIIRTPPPFKSRNNYALTFGLGGGAGGGGLFSAKSGKWYTKKHKVKTADQMLKTFGVGLGNGRSQGFKAPKMTTGKVPNFNASFSTKQFDKMFKQPKRRR